MKKDIFKKEGKFRYISKREIIIALVVSCVIFLILCDKPYITKNFYLFKPFLWKVSASTTLGYSIAAPVIGDESDINTDKVVIQDITEEAAGYATPKDYILKRVNEEQTKFEFQWDEVGAFEIGGGQEAYYFIFRPGGEYSGSKNLEVIIKKGETVYMVSYRSNWRRFDGNYKGALRTIKSFRIKN
jgi:hypothetical protein